MAKLRIAFWILFLVWAYCEEHNIPVKALCWQKISNTCYAIAHAFGSTGIDCELKYRNAIEEHSGI